MANILITGSKGVVGTQLAKELRVRGHKVAGIDLFHSSEECYTRCDISEYRQLERWFESVSTIPDFVYHTGAEFGRWNGEDYYEQLWKTNVIGTKHLIRLQEKYKFKLVHFSSSEVYGDYGGTMNEDNVPTVQLNDYAMTKWVNEMQIKNSATMYHTESVIIRLFNTYGAGETYHPYRSVNARFCHSALHGLPITVYRDYWRTSTYLDDTCVTLANIVDNFKAGETYNIGGNEYHSIETLADIIWKYTGANRDLITYKDAEPLTTKVKKVDVSKAIKDLGHKNTVSLEEGIKRILDSMK